MLDRNRSSVSQAGLVDNLNDGMAWGLFPLVIAAAGMNLAQVGLLAAVYPATWGVGQLATGALSDLIGRKPLIAWGMWTQAAGLGVVTVAQAFAGFVIGACAATIGSAARQAEVVDAAQRYATWLEIRRTQHSRRRCDSNSKRGASASAETAEEVSYQLFLYGRDSKTHCPEGTS